jgi:hypothetical protein
MTTLQHVSIEIDEKMRKKFFLQKVKKSVRHLAQTPGKGNLESTWESYYEFGTAFLTPRLVNMCVCVCLLFLSEASLSL